MNYLNYNGAILPADKEIIKADNRGFRYGDGLFETMRMINGCLPLAKFHFERLMKGIGLLQFEKPAYLTPAYLTAQIQELAEKNNHHAHTRVRLMIFRSEGGLYDAEDQYTNYIIQTWQLPDNSVVLNDIGLIIDVFPDARISSDSFSHLKSNNFLPYAMAALYAKKRQLHDCLLLNANGTICDATIANVFILKNARIITPPVTDGCIDGVMRRFLLEKLFESGASVIEQSITLADMADAEEVFLSNAIYGVKWVSRFRDTIYQHAATSRIFNHFIKKVF